MTIAPATNISTIQGEHTTANCARRLNPRMARVTTTAPTASTTRTKRMSSGYHFVCAGIPKSRRTAEADTVIIAPARMQYMIALHRLYSSVTPGPAMRRRYQYRVSRVDTAIGAQTNVQESTARRLPSSRPRTMSVALAPKLTSSAPITNSVAATCSPENRPAKYEPGSSLSSVTGARSNSYRVSRLWTTSLAGIG